MVWYNILVCHKTDYLEFNGSQRRSCLTLHQIIQDTCQAEHLSKTKYFVAYSCVPINTIIQLSAWVLYIMGSKADGIKPETKIGISCISYKHAALKNKI
jgi:hypothetical protein